MKRRPVVLLGGVGIGKTAVLARLTQLLAQRGAVPVPIRLRAAQGEQLDILDLARRKFLAKAPVLSEAEGDKIWRRLRDNDQVVIVADGLEEALMDVTDKRETAIRAAMEDVRRHGVAMIVSSRPHEALVHVDAAMVPLEPLESQAALEYITGSRRYDEETRARKIVDGAEVAEMPLFMHLARDLYLAGRLKRVNTRETGRLGLRVRILDCWMEALVDGRIHPAAPVTRERRKEVIQRLESYAAVGLTSDCLEVKFTDLYEEDAGQEKEQETDRIKEALGATTEWLREVAADGERLGLVDARVEGVRFRHSVTQAYLGSRAIARVLGVGAEEPAATPSSDAARERDRLLELLREGMRDPGRELLMALAMSCVACDETARPRAIQLLLKQVAKTGQKAVSTASAVIAAASASRSWASPPIAGADAPTETDFGHRDFRRAVILRLARAEREDATEEVARTAAAAEAAGREAGRAQGEMSAAVGLKHDLDARAEMAEAEAELDPTPRNQDLAAAGRARANDATAIAEALTEKADRHRQIRDREREKLVVALTIVAEKKLGEADAETNGDTRRMLRQHARDSLARALDEGNELGLGDHEVATATLYLADDEKVIGIRALAELAFVVGELAASRLDEAADETTGEEDRKRLLELARDRLAEVSKALQATQAAHRRERGESDDLLGAASRDQILVPLRETTRDHEQHGEEGVQASKLDAIARLGDAAQYLWLWEFCKREPDYLVRVSAARTLADGGALAFEVIEEELKAIAEAAWVVPRGETRRSQAAEKARERALVAVEPLDFDTPERAFELLGWVLPTLYASIEREIDDARQAECRDADDSDDADGRSPAPVVPPRTGDEPSPHRDLLLSWVRKVCVGVSLTSDMALAQGFRFAANDRELGPGQRGFLSARAEDLLEESDFWFSQVALLHALTLWLLRDLEPDSRLARGERNGTNRLEAERKVYGWCASSGHPFVDAAIELCAKALRKRQPENYLWLDEGLATAKLGAGRIAVRMGGSPMEWIPSSAGWLSLAPRAQRLLGEMVVLLNHADRGSDLRREELLKRTNKHYLPPCMSTRHGRAHLGVDRKLNEQVEPGAGCVPGCKMRLCPYPGLGEEMARGELSEAFCRRQHEIASHGRGFSRPDWQKMAPVDELKRFWRDMERRPRA